MKALIEKKLGCTIEEFKVKLDRHMYENKGYETEEMNINNITSKLNYDELDYLGSYMTELAKKENNSSDIDISNKEVTDSRAKNF